MKVVGEEQATKHYCFFKSGVKGFLMHQLHPLISITSKFGRKGWVGLSVSFLFLITFINSTDVSVTFTAAFEIKVDDSLPAARPQYVLKFSSSGCKSNQRFYLGTIEFECSNNLGDLHHKVRLA